jgi:hypothetical protein
MSEKTSDSGPATSKQLDGDRPAKGLADDRLGYAGFSRAMARAIHSMVPREGIVLAVNGAWGSGKTSAINMMVEALRELQADTSEDEHVVVVYFNPWWFSAQDDLVRAFFNDIASSLEEEKLSEKIVEGLKAVGRRASKAKDIVLGVLDFVPGGAVVKGVTGAAFDAVARASSVERSLAAERAELAEALRTQRRRILVVIDDVDRLPADEARQIFRMVKSVADLPNVIHLLVFDRAIARKALGAEINDDGPDWLDKVVQASFDLPPVRSADLQRLLITELDALAKPPPFINPVRWGNTLLSAIMPWVTSPRDVRRLANALAVSWPPVAREVDFADFVALETMRLFEPELHAMVKRNVATLTGGEQYERESGQRFADELLSKANAARREAAREALWRLFPRLERVWRNHSYSGGHHAEWDRERRVCVGRHFHAYFGFDIGEDALWQSEMEEAFADLANPQAFHDRVTDYAKRPRTSGGTKAGVLLDELLAHAPKLPQELLPSALKALALATDAFCDTGDDRRSSLSLPPIWQVWWVLSALARRVPIEARLGVIQAALEASPSLVLHSFVVHALAQEHGRDPERPGDRSDDPLIGEAALDDLQTLLLERLRASSRGGGLLSQRQPITLLLHWKDLQPDETRSWIAAQIETDVGALALGKASIQTGRSQSEGDRVGSEYLSVSRKVLADILDVDRLEARLAEVAGHADPEGQRVLDRFREGLKARAW